MLWLDNCRVARLIRTGPGRYRVGGVGCSNLETPLAIQALKIDFPLSDLDLATAIRSARTVEDRIQNQEPERSSKRRSRPRARMARNRSRMPVDAPGGLGRGSGRETGRDAPWVKRCRPGLICGYSLHKIVGDYKQNLFFTTNYLPITYNEIP